MFAQFVFVLEHEYEWCGRDVTRFLGVYATQADASAAVSRFRLQPGFCDWPDGFSITECAIGEDRWSEGFAIMVNILIPAKRTAGEYHGATAVWRPGDVYEICAVDDPSEVAFSTGDKVHCVEREVDGEGQALVATELVGKAR